ncbi:transcriptional regulator [Mesorhizobium shangrilense]|uniref:Transcriptional regulator n=1 Tax=Mesorhizobium shangrilense TaxID=460060 RepID=A0ABV2D724_9HYPH
MNAEINITSRDPSIAGFVARQKISRSSYYNLKAAGLGPREYVVGKLVRISAEAEAEWVRERESAEDARRSTRAA